MISGAVVVVAITRLSNRKGFFAMVEGAYQCWLAEQIVIAAGQGSEAALSVFEDLVNPYWKKEGVGS